MPFDETPDWTFKLGEIIGDEFEPAELEGIVIRSTGLGLYKEYVPRTLTDRETVRKLLEKLMNEGLHALFLAHII